MVQFTLDWLDYISLFFIIFMGIPHGALDGAISVTLGFTKSFYLQVRFIITYLFVPIPNKRFLSISSLEISKEKFL